jgi:hypothetical protein
LGISTDSSVNPRSFVRTSILWLSKEHPPTRLMYQVYRQDDQARP